MRVIAGETLVAKLALPLGKGAIAADTGSADHRNVAGARHMIDRTWHSGAQAEIYTRV